jgi:hypothetical protein
VLVHLGYLECRADRYAIAAAHARALLGLADPDGDPQLLSVGYFVLGWAEAFMGSVDDARTQAAEAARLSHAANDQLFWPHAEGVLGFIALSLGTS